MPISQMGRQDFNNARYMKIYLDDTNPDNVKVKTKFSKKPFSPEQFTCLIMGVIESYTASLLETNSAEAIFEHFNNAFGIFLNKLLPAEKIYEKSTSHKEFKDIVDKTLGAEITEEDAKVADENRLAAYILCRDILVNDIGLTEESADLILNRKIGLLPDAKPTLNAPKESDGANDGKEE